ncbi:MAG: hypothetical protein IJC25_06265 [Clostridia bacterium]|nr:hypothetical protein [Clostridia bacterium]
MNKPRRFVFSAVGAASLLTVFAVLCLTVFTLLSVSTVKANERLGDASAKAVLDYYRADCQAEAVLAALRAGQSVEGVRQENGVYRYECTVSPTRVLAVEVQIDGDEYQILRWQEVSSADWQADDRLPVWNGQL